MIDLAGTRDQLHALIAALEDAKAEYDLAEMWAEGLKMDGLLNALDDVEPLLAAVIQRRGTLAQGMGL